MSACKEPNGDKGVSLSKTIQLLKPAADAKAKPRMRRGKRTRI